MTKTRRLCGRGRSLVDEDTDSHGRPSELVVSSERTGRWASFAEVKPARGDGVDDARATRARCSVAVSRCSHRACRRRRSGSSGPASRRFSTRAAGRWPVRCRPSCSKRWGGCGSASTAPRRPRTIGSAAGAPPAICVTRIAGSSAKLSEPPPPDHLGPGSVAAAVADHAGDAGSGPVPRPFS